MPSGVISIDRFMRGRSPSQVPTETVTYTDVLQVDGSFTREAPVDINVYGRQSMGAVGENYSPDIAIGDPDTPRQKIPAVPKTPEQQSAEALQGISANQQKMINSQKLLAGAQLFSNVMNAQSQYAAVDESAKANIYMAHLAVADAKSRGAQEALRSVSEGRQRGDQAKLLMAAQGQDVTGSNVQRVVEGQEAVGVYDAMLAEINASREMLGYELEITEYERQRRDAKYNRNMQIFNSFLMFGAQTAPLG